MSASDEQRTPGAALRWLRQHGIFTVVDAAARIEALEAELEFANDCLDKAAAYLAEDTA
jgi:hypothetical protein